MAENILPTNVLRYLNLAEMYGLPQVGAFLPHHLCAWLAHKSSSGDESCLSSSEVELLEDNEVSWASEGLEVGGLSKVPCCSGIIVVFREDTFIRLISSSELLIMEGEMDIYQMIKAVRPLSSEFYCPIFSPLFHVCRGVSGSSPFTQIRCLVDISTGKAACHSVAGQRLHASDEWGYRQLSSRWTICEACRFIRCAEASSYHYNSRYTPAWYHV